MRATGNFHFGKMVLGDHVEGALVVVTLEGTGQEAALVGQADDGRKWQDGVGSRDTCEMEP